MPDGVVQWFDPATGNAAIVRGGRVFSATAADLEPVARHAGAHVHFDVLREQGVERAVDVTLRPGTRVSHHQRRYGTLIGARRADTKGPAPFARPHPERGRALASHPLEVARSWVDCLQAGDLDGALSLYAPDAVLHVDGENHVGRSHLGGYLEASPLLGVENDPDIRGEDGAVVVRWEWPKPAAGIEVRCRVQHGLLVEQWVGSAAPSARTLEIEAPARPVEVSVLTQGGVGEEDIAYAVERVAALLGHIDDPVLFARLKLDRAADPARARPAIAQVALDIDGELVRAHVAGHGMREAADLLQRHLADKLEQRAQHREWLRTRSGLPEPGEWRHGDLPSTRPEHFDRPVEDRRLVRHKTFAIDELTPDEAAFDMGQLDYDFHLFCDLASGEDAMLERLADGTFRLIRLHPTAVETGPASIVLIVDQMAPPDLTVPEAQQRLDAGGEPFLFFENSATHRGNVIYRRYDGHYGLVTPA